jgi:hypothetical protein
MLIIKSIRHQIALNSKKSDFFKLEPCVNWFNTSRLISTQLVHHQKSAVSPDKTEKNLDHLDNKNINRAMKYYLQHVNKKGDLIIHFNH